MAGNIEYTRAYTEVNCLLKYLPQPYIDKLPKKLIELIEYQSSDEYNITIDKTKSLLKQNFSKKTKDLISVIKYNYWSTEEEKEQLRKIFYENEKKYQEEIRKKYSPDNIFNNKQNYLENKEDTSIETAMVEYKERNFVQKLFDKIKQLFKQRIIIVICSLVDNITVKLKA